MQGGGLRVQVTGASQVAGELEPFLNFMATSGYSDCPAVDACKETSRWDLEVRQLLYPLNPESR